jgi:endonuclease/exonuclease/phosphatase family metal-dependent hydrolase
MALLLVACGSSPSPGGPSPASAEASPSTNPEFRVMTFNVQHAISDAGKYDTRWAIDTIAKVNPDLVGVQELTRNHPTYNCEDQPAKIADGISAATGRRWNVVYQQEWFTFIRDCPDSGRGDGAETEGLALFSPDPLSTSFVQLWNGRIGLQATLHRGKDVSVVVTHLAQAATGQADRVRQLGTLLPWTMARSAGAKLLICDCNLGPETPEYQTIRESYRDAWEDASKAGKAIGRSDGITHKSSRIDYVFYAPSDAFELVSVEVIDTKALIGTEASDHNPVVATFRLR